MPLSLPKQKIRVLLLEGVNDSAVRMFEANGYTEIERLPKALGSAELKRMLSGVHMLGIRSRTHLTEDVLQAADRLMVVGCFSVGTNQVDLDAAKRLGIPCAVISAPCHVQDFPARYSPQMGFEGANVLFDTWVHPLMMGLEEHLLGMFREDHEFADHAPSHLGAASAAPAPAPLRVVETVTSTELAWASDAERELTKIPFFVRGKARRNTERFARERNVNLITLETLYDAKAHFGR